MTTSQLNLELSKIEKEIKILHSLLDFSVKLNDSSITSSIHSTMSKHCQRREEIELKMTMEGKINIEDLPEQQQEYVREYQRILHGLADIQDQIIVLDGKAKYYLEELDKLRAKERAEFGEDNIL